VNCNKCRTMLSTYIDNELNNKDTRIVNEHLKNCSSCLKELEQFKNVKKILSRLEKKEPAPFFETRVMGRIRERASAPKTISDFIIAARKVIYAGISISVIFVGLNMLLLQPTDKNFYEGVEEYLLQNNSDAGGIKGSIIMKSEISKDDIMSLAFLEKEEQ